MTTVRVAVTAREQGVPQVHLEGGVLQPRLIERHSSGRVRIALVAAGAVLLRGDAIRIDVHVGEGCTLALEDVGGMVCYPGEGPVSHFDIGITVDTDAALTWATYPMVAASGAAVERRIDATVTKGSRLCLRETIVLGRAGEAGGRVHSRTVVRDEHGGALFIESLDLDGERPTVGVMGGYTVLDSVLLIGARPEDHGGARILELECPGVLARCVSHEAHRANLDPVWRQWFELVGGA